MAKADQRHVHRKRRARCALPGMMIHPEGRTHEWVTEQKGDWILTPDEATREHDSMFFVDGRTDRKYTPEFREAAIKQMIEGGRSMPSVARSLEMSPKRLANWVYRARRGQAILKRQPVKPVSEVEAEVTRLRQ